MTTEPVITPAPTAPGTCNQCLYWQPLEVYGHCRFHAPLVEAGQWQEGRVFWPRTLATDWCGQWQPAPLQREPRVVDG